MFPPIELNLYDQNDELKQTYQRRVIPWGLLKKAISIQKLNNAPAPIQKRWWEFWKKPDISSPEEIQHRIISQFVVELFGDKFTVRELEVGADTGEIMTVFQAVLTRANASMKANPTRKPSFKK